MKKISLAFLLSSTLLFASNTIELTAEYAKDLGNPFRVLLEKKDKDISIYSEKKDVILPVESNLDNNSIYSMNLQHPNTFVLKNESVENVVKQFYAEEFNVIKGDSKSKVIVNVLSGKVMLDYMNVEQNQQMTHLTKVEVELVVEIIKNGVKTVKTILMDNKLGIEGKNYSLSLTSDDFKNIEIKNLIVYVNNIIEVEIYKIIKEDQ
jgi:hypothetical protein